MKISFIGNGAMTKALAVNWKDKHELFISGRSSEKSEQMAKELNAMHGTIDEAIDFADVLLLAVPADVAEQTLAEHAKSHGYAGKLIIDISNPVSPETFTTTREDRSSVTEVLEKNYPKAMFGKSFNMAHTSVWQNAVKLYAGKPLNVLFTAHDNAKQTLAALINDMKANPVYLGNNQHAYQLEASAAIVIKFLFAGAPAETTLNLVDHR
jgi:predicted dinucleotide-binding enzyme